MKYIPYYFCRKAIGPLLDQTILYIDISNDLFEEAILVGFQDFSLCDIDFPGLAFVFSLLPSR